MADEKEIEPEIVEEDERSRRQSRRQTEKAKQEKLQKCIALRRERMGVLTSKMNELLPLLNDVQNLPHVKDVYKGDFACAYEEFFHFNNEIECLLPEDERVVDQEAWFEPKRAGIHDFMNTVTKWIAGQDQLTMMKEFDDENNLQDEVKPSDSASQVGVKDTESVHKGGSQVSHASTTSRVSSTRVRQEAEHAALLEHAAALKKKQQLAREEAVLKAAEAELKAKREELDLETALAASSAKIKVLKEHERQQDGMNSYVASERLRHDSTVKQERASKKIPPCLTPLPTRKGKDKVLPHLTCICWLAYQ